MDGVAQVVRNLPMQQHPDLIAGPEGFSDAGVFRLREDLLIVQSVDFFPPLVDDPFVYGQIAAANSMSDVFTMGARPTTALSIVGFPDDQLELEVLAEILRGGAERVHRVGAVVTGGHTVRDTEIKYGLSVTGVVEPERLMTNRDARPGDVLVLTKPLGTGFVTSAHKADRCPDRTLQAAIASMTLLNDGGRDAALSVGARAATDITGFGLVGHASELAQASQVTVVLDVDRLRAIDGVLELVDKRNMTRASASNRRFVENLMRVDGNPDPVRLELLFDAQTSGGLLISVPEADAGRLIDRAREAGAADTCVVGSVLAKQQHSLVVRG